VKPNALIISWIHPHRRAAGGDIRVLNTIHALQSQFEVTYLTAAAPPRVRQTYHELSQIVTRPIVMPFITQHSAFARFAHWGMGSAYAIATGLKRSNYVTGIAEFAQRRIADACVPHDYDLVVFEYWHTFRVVPIFRQAGVPCVLDMHEITWRSYERQLLETRCGKPAPMRSRRVRAYRKAEERAWSEYDAIVASNAEEAAIVSQLLPHKRVILAPKGVDMAVWPYCWSPNTPHRLAFYGSLGNRSNLRGVRRCAEAIMPSVWESHPSTEFWIVGSNPPAEITALAEDHRIHVTGFVEDAASVLSTMTAVLCPWEGAYGFRGRIVELAALGVPIVATPDAVWGMGIQKDRGVLLADSDAGLAEYCVRLLENSEFAKAQSIDARALVEDKYSFDATYAQLADQLYELSICPSR